VAQVGTLVPAVGWGALGVPVLCVIKGRESVCGKRLGTEKAVEELGRQREMAG
jgi:hypothetical protein